MDASHAAPYATPFSMYFAMVYDPDGNIVLLSGDLGGGSEVQGL